ncbi:MAG: pirin family protein [Myxococcota bacterium]|nr:pirin family protein [Myxococcota bacterium]
MRFTERKVSTVLKGHPTIEGAGVRLHRVFGFNEVPLFDPFLLLDAFGSANPEDYRAGFPWHPHRGIETISYVLNGDVNHGDSMGNQGTIGSGDVQWMTAGSGIIHQEMPKGDSQGRMRGFQLWANLPASHKMMQPRYRELKAGQIPTIERPNGEEIRVIAGEIDTVRGPMEEIIIEPEYFDIRLPKDVRFTHPTRRGHTVFAYVYEGQCTADQSTVLPSNHIALFEDGDQIQLKAGTDGARFILVSGKPLGEPVAWQGPIVMNTKDELRIAFEEYQHGTFVKPSS